MKVSRKKPAHRPTFSNKGGGVISPEIIQFLPFTNQLLLIPLAINSILFTVIIQTLSSSERTVKSSDWPRANDVA